MLSPSEFAATRRPASPEIVALLRHERLMPEGAVAFVYEDSCVIHEHEGLHWVHAWWYSPISYPSQAEAEAALYPWYAEFH